MISYNLNRLERWQQTNVADLNDDEIADPESEQAVLLDASHIEDVLQYEPHWEDAMLEQAISYAGRTVQERAFAERLDELALRSDRRKHGAGAGGVPPNDAYDPLEHWTSFHAEAARITERPAGSSILPAGAPDRAHGLPAPEPPMPLPLASPVVLISGEKESGETAEPQEDEGRQLRRRARKLREDAVRHETAARRVVRSLLPQPWLKKIDGDLDLAAIDREDIESLRRWQRELDDLHVKALLAWCKILATRPGPQMNREAARLLKHLQEQFRPDDFDVLLECRGCPGFSTSERRRYAQRLATVLRQWIAQDTSWMSLSWVEPDPHNPPDLFTPDERVALYARAASEKHLPDDVYFWLGDCLHELGRDDAGHQAYAHVLASQDPQALVRVGERFQSLDRWAESLQAYESARSLDPDESLENADFYRRLIGRALWKVNAYEGAVREFGATTDSSELGDSWRTTLVEELLRDMSVESPHRYRLLKRWLGQQLVTAQVDNRPLARQDAAEAILLLTQKRYHRLVRRGEEAPTENEPMLPLASPMLIEADPGFFPDGAQTEQVKRILEQEIPELRRVIAASFGISLPGVRIMPSLDSGSSAYRLAIDEIPIEEGHFENQEHWFVPDPQLANAILAGSVGVDPLTGRSGLWLANEPLPAADGWDRYGHIIRHLHAIVVAHLDRFLGVQELEQMLNDWTASGPPERWDLRAGALPDERARLRLVAVSRLLAAERVPLTDFTPILRALARADEAAEAAAIAESIRAELRPILPGVDGHGPLRTLPPLLEDRIQALLHVAAGKRFLAAPPGEIDTLRTAIGNHLGPDKGTPVVVLTPGLRPFVRRLLALDYTGVSVLAHSELPDLRLPVSSDTGAQTLVEAQR